MYAIIEKTHLRAIAFHDDKDAIDKYFDTLGRDTDRYWCGKVSKQNAKKIRNTNEYQELYLIQVGDILVPAKYYNAAEYLYEDIKYTYNTMIRNLERELEYSDDMGKKTKKAIETVICYLREKCDTDLSESVNSDYLDQLQEMYDEYKYNQEEPDDFQLTEKGGY